MTRTLKKAAGIPLLISALIKIAIDRGVVDLIGSKLHRLPPGVAVGIATALYAIVHGWSYFSNTSETVQAWEPGWLEVAAGISALLVEVLARFASARSGDDSADGEVKSQTKMDKEYETLPKMKDLN